MESPRPRGHSARPAAARALVAFGVALVLACDRPATGIVVRVDSELPWGPGQRVQSVVLEVRRAGPGGPLRSRRATPVGVGDGRRPLPLFVGVNESVGDTDTPLWIEALACAVPTGCVRDAAVSAQRAVVRFVPEQTVELAMLLSSACGATRCALDQQCTPAGACVAASGAQATLRRIDAVPSDAASVAVPLDAAVDATTDAAPMRDETSPVDATADRPDVAPVDRVTPDDVPTDATTSDAPGDTRPTDVTSPDAAPPDVARVDVAAPDAPTMDVAVMDVAAMDVAAMDVTAMDVTAMDVAAMDVAAMDSGVDAPTDVAATDAGPRDAATMDAPSGDTGTTTRCPAGMLAVPAGQFLMGSTVSAFEQPVHGVRLSAFCVDETEVTVAEYRACVATGICAFPTSGAGCNYPMTGRDEHPINCVTWGQAQTYCIWRGGRLPTEAQWEYVARGPTSRLYPWGAEAPTSRLVCATPEGPAATSTCPVATHRAGDSPFGAADMAGNVWEWVLEDYAPYTGSSTTFVTDPSGTTVGNNRTIRGAAFNATGPDIFRGAFRSLTDINNRRENIGFRCVRSPL